MVGTDSLVEVRLGDGQEAAVPVGLDGEDEGFPGEHGQLAHHLPRARDKQAAVFVAVDLPLVHVQQPGHHKQDVHVLAEGAWPRSGLFALTAGSTQPCPSRFCHFIHFHRRLTSGGSRQGTPPQMHTLPILPP